MEKEPKGGLVPLIAAGALMVVCCAGPVIFGAVGASVLAWLSGFGAGETGAVALLVAAFVYAGIRLRRAINVTDANAATRPSRIVK